jgi:hypothetical protein
MPATAHDDKHNRQRPRQCTTNKKKNINQNKLSLNETKEDLGKIASHTLLISRKLRHAATPPQPSPQ